MLSVVDETGVDDEDGVDDEAGVGVEVAVNDVAACSSRPLLLEAF